MRRNPIQNRIALTLALTCLFWAGYMMVPMGHHLMEHGKPAKHSGQHSSTACVWMCASSDVSQSSFPFFDYEILPFLCAISVLLNTPFLNFSASQLRTRAPPA